LVSLPDLLLACRLLDHVRVLMTIRFPALGPYLLVLAMLSFVWGCEQPSTNSNASATQSDTIAAGTISTSALVDSIRAGLDSTTAAPADTAALRRWSDALTRAGDSIASRRPDSARGLYQRALRAGRALGDSVRVAQKLSSIANTYATQAQYEAALKFYRRALSISREHEHLSGVAKNLSEMGEIHRHRGDYEIALEHLREALARYREQGAETDIASVAQEIGIVHAITGRHEQALTRWNEALALFQDAGDQVGTAQILGNMGILHKNRGRYDKALARYREILDIQRRRGRQEDVAKTLSNIGIVYKNQGRYDKALARYQESLAIHQERGNRSGIAATLNNIGSVYENQGRDEQALSYYRKSLAVKRKIGERDGIATALNNIGIIHRRQGRVEQALTYYRKSLSVKREIEDRDGEARTLNNIGGVHRRQGRYEQALTLHRKALSIQREIEDRDGVASTLGDIGDVYRRQERTDDALRYYRRAIQLDREMGRQAEVARNLEDIGTMHLAQGARQAATDTLERAARLTETLRSNATSPEARRSLFETQIETYRGLITSHVRAGRPDSALRTVEQARARLLAERLTGTAQGDTTFTIPSATRLRQTLGPDEGALLYANAGGEWPITVVVATQDTTYAHELPESRMQAAVGNAHAASLRKLRQTEGPLTAALGEENSSSAHKTPTLAETIRLYRHSLTQNAVSDSIRRNLSRRLHDLLIGPVADRLRGKETITVVPTGALGYVPFEALRDASGRYLVEEKQIHYTQSLTVLRQLQGRSYAAPERSLLAIGGAAYGGPSSDAERPLLAEARSESDIGSEKEASALYRSAKRRMERGESPRSTYSRLGYGQWSALYGSELEVQKLGRAMGRGATLLTGPDASEKRVRQTSESGELSTYRYLHFATHGIAVPEAPSLSALVLSQVGASDSLAAQDGYLTMSETADLKMQADVAVLSACRTGLGRIVAGEGVVGLSHAFLRAGANATLVSQWRVLDWSTQQFMTATYRRAQAKDVSFAEATAQVKRAFIEGAFGERNADPLRWAPFVYYGRE